VLKRPIEASPKRIESQGLSDISRMQKQDIVGIPLFPDAKNHIHGFVQRNTSLIIEHNNYIYIPHSKPNNVV
jgi:hypothetical protein